MNWIIDSILGNVCLGKMEVFDDTDTDTSAILTDKAMGYIEHVFNGTVSRTYVAKRISYVKRYREQLKHLITLPIVEQRSAEWHELRNTLITASDFAQAIGKGKFSTQRDFFKKKCGYEKSTFVSAPPLEWGVKYEPVATSLYEARMGVHVHEFGLIPHPVVSFIGASPDGISEFGVMVEIKCPYKRKITGEIPDQYYHQIQGQLEVCDLDECDYYECSLKEYSNKMYFMNDTCSDDPKFTVDFKEKGIVVEYRMVYDDADSKLCYKYSEVYKTTDELVEWEQKTVDSLRADPGVSTDSIRSTYWYLDMYLMKRVYRDRAFWHNLLADLTIVWKRVGEYKLNKDAYVNDIEMTPREKKRLEREAAALVAKEVNKNAYNSVMSSQSAASASAAPRRGADQLVQPWLEEALQNKRGRQELDSKQKRPCMLLVEDEEDVTEGSGTGTVSSTVTSNSGMNMDLDLAATLDRRPEPKLFNAGPVASRGLHGPGTKDPIIPGIFVPGQISGKTRISKTKKLPGRTIPVPPGGGQCGPTPTSSPSVTQHRPMGAIQLLEDNEDV